MHSRLTYVISSRGDDSAVLMGVIFSEICHCCVAECFPMKGGMKEHVYSTIRQDTKKSSFY